MTLMAGGLYAPVLRLGAVGSVLELIWGHAKWHVVEPERLHGLTDLEGKGCKALGVLVMIISFFPIRPNSRSYYIRPKGCPNDTLRT